MIYSEAVDYIHSLLRFGIRPGLTGMGALLCYLGNPQDSLKFVHVAGTNGKGSISTAISNVLVESGCKVGLYTSPFVSDFLERVQFQGEPINKEIFANNVEKVKTGVEKLKKDEIIITEFEALTAAAFLCFKELKCDVAVLEVGLGGRLDATNVIKTPLVNVIASLSLDHTAILGDTIEQIAFEKCGTIKKNSNVVASYGQDEKALAVIKDTVTKKEGSLVLPNEADIKIIKSDIFGTEFSYKNENYFVTMPGTHQVKNMTSVIEACKILGETFHVTEDSIYKGIKKTVLPARVEVLSQEPFVILDGGHNEDGAKAFYEATKELVNKKDKVYVLGGMMADKAVETSLAPLLKSAYCFVPVTPENPRSMRAEELAEIGRKYCKNTIPIDNPLEALDFILERIKPQDAFFAVGSLYLAGEIRNYLIKKLKEF